jgi:hypothetical protein
MRALSGISPNSSTVDWFVERSADEPGVRGKVILEMLQHG